MKKTSILSALALAVTVSAAPLAAEQVKPVEPTVSSQGGVVTLGTLGPAGTAAIVVVGIAAIAAVADGGSTSDTTSE